MLDVPLPGEAVLDDVQRLVRNLIAMNEILRDPEHVSIRLVMNPDRMVIDEARRTFTYLNLYGFLTDAVVVNRVFPEEVGAYFERLARAPAGRSSPRSATAFAPVPVLRAPYFDEEVVGARRCSTASATRCSPTLDAAAVLHAAVTQELVVGERRRRRCAWTCRSPRRATSR